MQAVQSTTYGGSQIPPGHRVPPRDVEEPLGTHAVPCEANVAGISNEEGDEIAANDFDLRGGPEQRQAHETHSQVHVAKLMGQHDAILRGHERLFLGDLLCNEPCRIVCGTKEACHAVFVLRSDERLAVYTRQVVVIANYEIQSSINKGDTGDNGASGSQANCPKKSCIQSIRGPREARDTRWTEKRCLYLEWRVALNANWTGLGLRCWTRMVGLQRHGLEDRKDDAGKLRQQSSHDGCALYVGCLL